MSKPFTKKYYIRIIGIMLALLLPFTVLHPISAQETASLRYESEAAILHQIGLYDGIDIKTYDPDLSSPVNRETGITLLVKMFGKKDIALSLSEGEINTLLAKYEDRNQISSWARGYLAYAVKTSMATGDTASTLSPKKPLDGRSFATMILRNLGYTIDSEGWRIALYTLAEYGGPPFSAVADFSKASLIKDDLVGIAHGALYAKNQAGKMLVELLIEEGVVLEGTAKQAGLNTESSQDPSLQNLTETEIVTNIIKEALKSVQATVQIPKYSISDTADEISTLLENIIRDNQDPLILNWYCNAFIYYINTGILELKYTIPHQTILSYSETTKKKAYLILSEIMKPGMTEYDKELAAHDYIIRNTEYDNESYLTGNIPPESSSAYGVLVLNKAVCSGYSYAMKLLMDSSGIECMYVKGQAKSIGKKIYEQHAWNIVKLANSYYQVDVTWDDPLSETDSPDILKHTFFNLTDSELALTHTWDRIQIPPCTSSEYNYYVYNNLVLNSSEELYAAIKYALANNLTHRLNYKVPFYYEGFDLQEVVSRAFASTDTKLSYSYIYSEDNERKIIELQFSK